MRPTLLTGVPRAFEKLHDRIMEKGQAEPGLKGWIFSWAVGAGAAAGGGAAGSGVAVWAAVGGCFLGAGGGVCG